MIEEYEEKMYDHGEQEQVEISLRGEILDIKLALELDEQNLEETKEELSRVKPELNTANKKLQERLDQIEDIKKDKEATEMQLQKSHKMTQLELKVKEKKIQHIDDLQSALEKKEVEVDSLLLQLSKTTEDLKKAELTN